MLIILTLSTNDKDLPEIQSGELRINTVLMRKHLYMCYVTLTSVMKMARQYQNGAEIKRLWFTCSGLKGLGK
jgi:hypothetical protein